MYISDLLYVLFIHILGHAGGGILHNWLVDI